MWGVFVSANSAEEWKLTGFGDRVRNKKSFLPSDRQEAQVLQIVGDSLGMAGRLLP